MNDAPELSAGVRPGDVIAGKYRVDRVLGMGGMGVVVAAHHVQLDERVALKFLLPDAACSVEAMARFEREARAAAKIKSEHVARVSDVGTLENGAPYMVMEYLDGVDLDVWLKQRGVLSVEQAVDFILQASEALAEAHSLGIVHRDLKPANLFCIERADGQLSIKVLDFGISKLTAPGEDRHGMTSTSARIGSPYYMSPEQMQSGKGVDARSDVWALGIILFEFLTGRPPFAAESVTDLAIKVATEPTPSLRGARSGASAGLEAVVSRCLEKDRGDRFQDIGELARALAPFAPAHARLSVDRVVGTLSRSPRSGSLVPGATGSAPGSAMRAPLYSTGSYADTVAEPSTGEPWQTSGARSNGDAARFRVPVWLAAAAGLLVLAVGTTAVLDRGARTTAALPSAASEAPTANAGAADAPSAIVSAVPALRAAVPEAPSVIAPAPAIPATTHRVHTPAALTPPAPMSPAPMSPAPRPPLSSPPRPSPRTAPSATAPSCDPPFYFDDKGTKHFKKECT